jgi:hypothetical protein
MFKNENKIFLFDEESFEEELLTCKIFKAENLYKDFVLQNIHKEVIGTELNNDEKKFVENILKKNDPVKFKCAIL